MGERKIERETGAGERKRNRDGREKDRKRDRSRRETETERGRERERDRGEREKITNTKRFLEFYLVVLHSAERSEAQLLSCYNPLSCFNPVTSIRGFVDPLVKELCYILS